MTLKIRTGTNNLKGDISFSYFSDTTRYDCGYEDSRAPGLYSSPTMILTDGTKSQDQMKPGLDCKWLISPNVKGVGAVNYDEGDEYTNEVEVSLS